MISSKQDRSPPYNREGKNQGSQQVFQLNKVPPSYLILDPCLLLNVVLYNFYQISGEDIGIRSRSGASYQARIRY